MQRIDLNAVRGWTTSNSVRYPNAISSVCPHCSDRVVFSLGDSFMDNARLAVVATGLCPSCKKLASFWAMREQKIPKDTINNPIAIYMYPPVRDHYPTPEFSDDIPEALQRSFISTIDAFNSKNYVATTVGGRRTLEGIFKYLVPEEKRKANLAKLIEFAKAEVDLAAPLSALSHAIRDGGNLGAHFDMEKEPSEALARQMVELLEYLISYLYVLPKEIKKLEQNLGRDA
jgi:hypothetical protein